MLASLFVILALFSLFLVNSHVDRVRTVTSPSHEQDLLFQDEDIDSDSDLFRGEADEFSGNAQHRIAISATGPAVQSAKSHFPLSCPTSQYNGTVAAKYLKYPSLIKDSVLHSGSGDDLVRVLRRAQRLSSNLSEKGQPGRAAEGNDAFRVMVIGGSGKSRC